jgi:hypothetical protein
MKRIMMTTRVLAVPAVVAMALLAGCGGDSGDATSTAAPATARLRAQAEQFEWSAHLQGQAKTYSTASERQPTVGTDQIGAGNRAVAEQLERNAKLEGQASTHGKANSTDYTARPGEPSDNEFVPGSRHMPMR